MNNFVSLVLVFFFFFSGFGNFFSGFSNTLFGGKIEKVIDGDLACGGGKYIKVGDPRSGEFVKTTDTNVYDYESIEKGNWVLGLASDSKKKVKKMEYDPVTQTVKCKEKGEGKEIKMIGTSK